MGEFRKGGCPGGGHTLRARRMGMKPGLETLDEDQVRQSWEHKVDEVTKGAAIEGEKNFQDKCSLG